MQVRPGDASVPVGHGNVLSAGIGNDALTYDGPGQVEPRQAPDIPTEPVYPSDAANPRGPNNADWQTPTWYIRVGPQRPDTPNESQQRQEEVSRNLDDAIIRTRQRLGTGDHRQTTTTRHSSRQEAASNGTEGVAGSVASPLSGDQPEPTGDLHTTDRRPQASQVGVRLPDRSSAQPPHPIHDAPHARDRIEHPHQQPRRHTGHRDHPPVMRPREDTSPAQTPLRNPIPGTPSIRPETPRSDTSPRFDPVHEINQLPQPNQVQQLSGQELNQAGDRAYRILTSREFQQTYWQMEQPLLHDYIARYQAVVNESQHRAMEYARDHPSISESHEPVQPLSSEDRVRNRVEEFWNDFRHHIYENPREFIDAYNSLRGYEATRIEGPAD